MTCEWCRAAPATRDALIAPERRGRFAGELKDAETRIRVCNACGAIVDRAHDAAEREASRARAERRLARGAAAGRFRG